MKSQCTVSLSLILSISLPKKYLSMEFEAEMSVVTDVLSQGSFHPDD